MKTPKEKAIENKYLKGKGRYTNESLFLEYTEEAIKDDRFKEHCIDLWYNVKDVKKALAQQQKEIDGKEQEIKVLTQMKRNFEDNCKNLNNENTKLKKEIDNLQMLLSMTSDTCEQQVDELMLKQKEIDELKKENKELRMKVVNSWKQLKRRKG